MHVAAAAPAAAAAAAAAAHAASGHPLCQLGLVAPGHENVPLVHLDEERAEDLTHCDAARVRLAQDAQGGDVDHDLALLALGVVLERKNVCGLTVVEE